MKTTNTKTLAIQNGSGIVHDFASERLSQLSKSAGERRSRNMERAHAQGHAACEVCGRAISDEHPAALTVHDSWLDLDVKLGPTCSRRFLAWFEENEVKQ